MPSIAALLAFAHRHRIALPIGSCAVTVIAANGAWAYYDPANTAWTWVNFAISALALMWIVGAFMAEPTSDSDPAAAAWRSGAITSIIVLIAATVGGEIGGRSAGTVYWDADTVDRLASRYCYLTVDSREYAGCSSRLSARDIHFDLTKRPAPGLWSPRERTNVEAVVDEMEQAQAKEQQERWDAERLAALAPDVWRDPDTGCEYFVQKTGNDQTYRERRDASGKQLCRPELIEPRPLDH